MKQHPVPENIMDVEFKLFGSLTAKQFGYIVAGGVGGVVLFYLFRGLQSTFLGWIFASLSAMLGLSLALVRINEQPFEVWLGNFLTAMFSSQKRVWQKQKKTSSFLSGEGTKTISSAATAQSSSDNQNSQQATVTSPGTQQSVQGNKNDSVTQIPAKSIDAKQEQSSIPTHPFKDFSGTPPMVPKQPNLIAGEPVEGETFNVPGSAQGYVKMSTNQEPNRPISVQTNMTNTLIPVQNFQSSPASAQASNATASGGSDSASSAGSNVSDDQTDPNKTSFQVVEPVIKRDKEPETFFLNDELNQASQSQPQSGANMQNSQTPAQPSVYNQQSQPIQPPPSPGQSVPSQTQGGSLPAQRIMNKGQQFKDILPKKQDVIGGSASSDLIPAASVQSNELEEANKALRQKVAEFSEEKSRLEGELGDMKNKYTSLESQNRQMQSDLEAIKKQLEAKTLPVIKPSPQSIPAGSGQQLEEKGGSSFSGDGNGALSPQVYNGPALSKKQNVISGIVKSKSGKLLPGVVVIVKNEKGRPVRAMKTNSLGQFVTTTALENGNYMIELSKNDLSFGKYELILEGNVMPTYEFLSY
ncbi:MAG: PrgI family protein [Candidatus Dojkabacteria bacterium]|nr:PrgI family protein [Candidatus Dojkabacteria bacterium]